MVNDFGFSFEEDDIQFKETAAEAIAHATDSHQRLMEVMIRVESFLDRLCLQPNKPTIKWPNRVAEIERFKETLQDIAKG